MFVTIAVTEPLRLQWDNWWGSERGWGISGVSVTKMQPNYWGQIKPGLNRTKHGANSEVSCQVTDRMHRGFIMDLSRRFPRDRSLPLFSYLTVHVCVYIQLQYHLACFFIFKHYNAFSKVWHVFCVVVFQYYFTVTFNHDNQKALELRTEDVKDCDEWVAAITQARYLSHMTSHLDSN